MTPAERLRALLSETMRPDCFADFHPVDRSDGLIEWVWPVGCGGHEDCDRALHRACTILYGDEVPCFGCWMDGAAFDGELCPACDVRVVRS